MHVAETQEQSQAKNAVQHAATVVAGEEVSAEAVPEHRRTSRIQCQLTTDGNSSEDLVSGTAIGRLSLTMSVVYICCSALLSHCTATCRRSHTHFCDRYLDRLMIRFPIITWRVDLLRRPHLIGGDGDGDGDDSGRRRRGDCTKQSRVKRSSTRVTAPTFFCRRGFRIPSVPFRLWKSANNFS